MDRKIRYSITLPLRDNAGVSIDYIHVQLEKQLVALAGGCSITSSRGSWKNPKTGEAYTDASLVYHVDVDGPLESEILALAGKIAIEARQECIYVTKQAIQTTLVWSAS